MKKKEARCRCWDCEVLSPCLPQGSRACNTSKPMKLEIRDPCRARKPEARLQLAAAAAEGARKKKSFIGFLALVAWIRSLLP